MKNLIKLIWNKSTTGWKFVYILCIPFFCLCLLSISSHMAGIQPQEIQKVSKPRHEQWQLDRLQVAARHINKYSPYSCNVYKLEESFVSSYDNHTAHLVCDNWNRFEVATVAGQVKVQFKG